MQVYLPSRPAVIGGDIAASRRKAVNKQDRTSSPAASSKPAACGLFVSALRLPPGLCPKIMQKLHTKLVRKPVDI